MGTSKALLPFGSETMLQRVVRLLRTEVSPIAAVAAVDQVLPELPAYVTSCDVPLLVPAFVRQMLDLARGYDIAVMEIDGFPHPLSAVYRRQTLPLVEELLAHDRLRPVFAPSRLTKLPDGVDTPARCSAGPAAVQALLPGGRSNREIGPGQPGQLDPELQPLRRCLPGGIGEVSRRLLPVEPEPARHPSGLLCHGEPDDGVGPLRRRA